MHEFKIGDVVQLKSGSPAMTIRSIGDPLAFMDKEDKPIPAICDWFDGKKSKQEQYLLDQLKVAD